MPPEGTIAVFRSVPCTARLCSTVPVLVMSSPPSCDAVIISGVIENSVRVTGAPAPAPAVPVAALSFDSSMARMPNPIATRSRRGRLLRTPRSSGSSRRGACSARPHEGLERLQVAGGRSGLAGRLFGEAHASSVRLALRDKQGRESVPVRDFGPDFRPTPRCRLGVRDDALGQLVGPIRRCAPPHLAAGASPCRRGSSPDRRRGHTRGA